MPRRICIAQDWKREAAKRRGEAPVPKPTGAGAPLLNGKIYVANITFQGGGTLTAVPMADLVVTLDYLRLALPIIAAYAGQYGPTNPSLAPDTIPLTVAVSGRKYSDMDLQGWVNQLVKLAGLPPSSALLLLNPPGVVNTDAQETGGLGVLGYHGVASIPYSFVNLLGKGLTLEDQNDLYAEALSHEIAEMTVDPSADARNPEVCDGCGTNCQGNTPYRLYFDAAGGYVGSGSQFPPDFGYAFFLSAIAKPTAVTECPAPGSACAYPPP